MISASSLERVAACPESEALQHARTIDAYSEDGDVGHEYLANIASGMPKEEALLLAPPERRPWLAAIDLDRLPVRPDQFQPEVAFLYDVATSEARVIGQRIDRSYEQVLGRKLTPSEIPGTSDSIGLTVDGLSGAVGDYKTGWADPDHVVPAWRNWQLRFLALCLARVYGLLSVVVAILRFNDDGTPRMDTAEIDAAELEIIAAQVESVYARVEAARARAAAGDPLTVTQGKHCRYCPAFLFCPAKQALIGAALVAVKQPDSTFFALPESDEAIAEVRERALAAQKLLEALIDQIKERASRRPIPLPSGKWYGEVRRMGDPSYDAEGIRGYLAERFGEDLASKAIETRTTWAAVERAVKAWAYEQKRKPGKVLEQIERDLVDRGLLRRVPIKRIAEFKASPEQVEGFMAERASIEAAREAEESAQLQRQLESSVQAEQPALD